MLEFVKYLWHYKTDKRNWAETTEINYDWRLTRNNQSNQHKRFFFNHLKVNQRRAYFQACHGWIKESYKLSTFGQQRAQLESAKVLASIQFPHVKVT